MRRAVGGAVPRVVVTRERGAIGHALLGDQALQRREPVAPGLYPACRPVAGARLCYITIMTNKTATKPSKDKRRRTTLVPVTTMEEIPVLSAKERADLLASLKAAEGRAKAGKAIDYDRKTFKERLIGIYRGHPIGNLPP